MPFDDYKESVAIYLRKSRMDPDSEDIDETLARHEDTLLKLAKQMDLNIVEIYRKYKMMLTKRDSDVTLAYTS